MTTISQLIDQLKQANIQLKKASDLPGDNEYYRDATIQRFEFTFELVWKLLQVVAKDQGKQEFGPKNAFRFAATIGLIDDPEPWFAYHHQRNLTSHIYNQQMAESVYSEIKLFYQEVERFLLAVERYLK